MVRFIGAAALAFLQDRNGSSAIEYGLLTVFFVAICMAVIGFFGDSIGLVQGDVAEALAEAAEEG